MDAETFKDFYEENKSSHKSKDTCTIIGLQGRQYTVDIFYSVDPVPNYIQCVVQVLFYLLLDNI